MATKIAQKIYFSKFLSKLFRPYRSKSFRVFLCELLRHRLQSCVTFQNAFWICRIVLFFKAIFYNFRILFGSLKE